MDRFPPTINPRVFTLSSVIVGYLLIDNFTANEQNSIGNWFMTVGQILECNASMQQTVEERFQGDTININSQQFKNGGSPYLHNKGLYPREYDDGSSNSNGSNGNSGFGNSTGNGGSGSNKANYDGNDNTRHSDASSVCREDELESIKRAIQMIQEELNKMDFSK